MWGEGRVFGPGRPVEAVWEEGTPRLFEYPPGINLVSTPRAGFGLAPFGMLRNLAGMCKEIRLNIELIKRQVRGLEWKILPMDQEVTPVNGGSGLEVNPEVRRVREFFECPDGMYDFDAWVNMLIEEVLVTDAVTLWPTFTHGSTLTPSPSPWKGEGGRMELVDGTTIRPLLDVRGRSPEPPVPAYVQMIHGMPLGMYSRERLIYRPLNTAVNSPYGSSPIEWFLLAVNLAMRRDVFHVAMFTEGNVPEALVGAPSSWSQDQVDTWQTYWDALVSGNVKGQRRMHWIPLEGSRSGVPVYEFRRDDLGVTERDKWLMQVACWAFGNAPSEFGLAPGEGLGGKGYGESMQNVQYRSMIYPVAQYLKRLFDYVIRVWLGSKMKFMWVGLEPQEDRLQQAQIDQVYIQSGVYTEGYVQERLGIPREYRPTLTPGPSPFQGEGEASSQPFPWASAGSAGGEGEPSPRPSPLKGEGELMPTVEPVRLPREVGQGKFFRGRYP